MAATMTCADARERFLDAVDGELALTDRDAFDAHLRGCADCHRELERYRGAVSLLHRIEPVRAPVGFVDRVLAAAGPQPWARRLFRRLLLPLPVKLPLEAAAIVLVGVGVVYVFQSTPELQQAARVETFQTDSAPRTGTPGPTPPTVLLDRPHEARETAAVPQKETASPEERSLVARRDAADTSVRAQAREALTTERARQETLRAERGAPSSGDAARADDADRSSQMAAPGSRPDVQQDSLLLRGSRLRSLPGDAKDERKTERPPAATLPEVTAPPSATVAPPATAPPPPSPAAPPPIEERTAAGTPPSTASPPPAPEQRRKVAAPAAPPPAAPAEQQGRSSAPQATEQQSPPAARREPAVNPATTPQAPATSREPRSGAAAPPSGSRTTERPSSTPAAPRAEPKAERDAAGVAPAPRPRVGDTAATRAAADAVAKASTVSVAGRLAVPDRSSAERAVADIAARHRAAVTARREESDATVVELVVPGETYRALTSALREIGRWQPDAELAELPAAVRLTIRLTR